MRAGGRGARWDLAEGGRRGRGSGPVELTWGPCGSDLLLVAMPVLAGTIGLSLKGSVDAVWVGRFVGEAAGIILVIIGMAFVDI